MLTVGETVRAVRRVQSVEQIDVVPR